jgi:hypothetical protein
MFILEAARLFSTKPDPFKFRGTISMVPMYDIPGVGVGLGTSGWQVTSDKWQVTRFARAHLLIQE